LTFGKQTYKAYRFFKFVYYTV